jgi:hypothetical protein
MRRAAFKYKDARFKSMMARVPPTDETDRLRLLAATW